MELKARLVHTNEAFEKDVHSLTTSDTSEAASANARLEDELMEMQLTRTTLKERIEHLTNLIITSSSLSAKMSLEGSVSKGSRLN